MKIDAEIRYFEGKILAGIRRRMSLTDDRTYELWRSFMPLRNQLSRVSPDLYSVKVYEPEYNFTDFNPRAEFDKWAAAEVTGNSEIPEGMERLSIFPGAYAIFSYRGSSEKARELFSYIFFEWLPSSGHLLENRPHFEILGEKFRLNDPSSEEEIWIPVRG